MKNFIFMIVVFFFTQSAFAKGAKTYLIKTTPVVKATPKSSTTEADLGLNPPSEKKKPQAKVTPTKPNEGMSYNFEYSHIPGLNHLPKPSNSKKPNQVVPDPDMAVTFTYNFS